MLLEAQMETENSDSPLLVLSSPGRDEKGAVKASEQPVESELSSPRSLPQPGCSCPRQVRGLSPRAARAAVPAAPWPQLPHTSFQRDMLEEAEWRKRRLPASLGWTCARRPPHLPPKEFAFVCSPQPVLWSLQGGAVGRKKSLFSSELLLLFIPSLLLSHLLTLGLG
ncbi:BNI3L protein, partial [Turnix velox]|nr:BNI3L protein [Turnix velox]